MQEIKNGIDRTHLYFNWRIYEYGDKVKVLILWKSVGFKPLF